MTPEDDVETGTNTCCRCFNCTTGEDTKPVLIAFTVRNETNTNIEEDDDDIACQDEDLPNNLHKAAAMLW